MLWHIRSLQRLKTVEMVIIKTMKNNNKNKPNNKTTIYEEAKEAKEKEYQPAPSPEGKPRLKRVDDVHN